MPAAGEAGRQPVRDRQGHLDPQLPHWQFDQATLDRAAQAFDNPDYVEVVIHSYRHRLGFAPSHPPCDQLEQHLAAQPPLPTPPWKWPPSDPRTRYRYERTEDDGHRVARV